MDISEVSSADHRPAYRIGFLLIDDFAMMSFASTCEPLRAANRLAGRTVYDIRYIPVSGASSRSSSGAVFKANAHVGEQVDFDLVMVLAGGNPLVFHDERIFRWLRHLSARGIQLGGVSGGPAILALAGVMENRRMTVHWEHARALATILPDLLIERSLYVMDRDRLTCAGGIAPLDMMHALITSQHGAKFARKVSDWFMHTQVRPSGGAQRSGLVERYGTTNLPVILTIEAMINHIADTLSLDQLANLAQISSRQLNRLFNDKLNETTMVFYRNLRLEKARSLLLQTSLSLTEIALATGFASSAHFSSAFRNRYSMTPSSCRS